jgi:hypothetical protein
VIHRFYQPAPYAETHYVVRTLPISRYRRRCPEIIVDIPRRVEPGFDLPVLLIVKDAHRYPVTIHSITIQSQESGLLPHEFTIDQKIDVPFWSKLFTIPIDKLPHKLLTLNVLVRVSQKGREFYIQNDNYIGTSHTPLSVNISEYPFPKLPGLVVGDLHVHTRYTDDQVEFGAPIFDTAYIAQAQGLDFFAAADHSYNLDDTWDNYLRNDPHLSKYKSYQEEIDSWNLQNGNTFQVIPGIEVSAGNKRHRNVHLLVLGSGEFISGKGDSAETWFRTHPDLSISQVIERLESNRIALAAHPEMPFPFSERWFLGRGFWENLDFANKGLVGLQVVRGTGQIPFQDGVNLWVKLLLQGLKLSITAGSDAHGDFNRYIKVYIPMISLKESHHPVFGEALTLIPIDHFPSAMQGGIKGGGIDSLTSCIQTGRTGITTGPGISLHFQDEQGQTYLPGSSNPSPQLSAGDLSAPWGNKRGVIKNVPPAIAGGKRRGVVALEAVSSPEFGSISHTLIWAGNQNLQAEELVWIDRPANSTFKYEREVVIEGNPDWNYLRAEVRTLKNEEIGRALTGAIYF